ncbi:MAG: HalX domain-containing protein [Haloplanus sp.]
MLRRLSTYDERIREQFALTEKKATLEAEKMDAELARSEEYAALVEQVESIQAETADLVESIDHDDASTAFAGLSTGEQ